MTGGHACGVLGYQQGQEFSDQRWLRRVVLDHPSWHGTHPRDLGPRTTDTDKCRETESRSCSPSHTVTSSDENSSISEEEGSTAPTLSTHTCFLRILHVLYGGYFHPSRSEPHRCHWRPKYCFLALKAQRPTCRASPSHGPWNDDSHGEQQRLIVSDRNSAGHRAAMLCGSHRQVTEAVGSRTGDRLCWEAV